MGKVKQHCTIQLTSTKEIKFFHHLPNTQGTLAQFYCQYICEGH